ncbi:hypothetical protein SAMN05421858_2790 [Haladaptatus litoreus]|uniref:Uncharacterized protein n=1 Tax=Haladaptatus litoreus TaxID=553468 RepID=A0A1N7BVW3_9EURY|nr:hypothetical protein [Haladaptatus litoreus]SIR55479.1 hypothetical protein SAMN05421858_2790 [Haladaptatus litoreus]
MRGESRRDGAVTELSFSEHRLLTDGGEAEEETNEEEKETNEAEAPDEEGESSTDEESEEESEDEEEAEGEEEGTTVLYLDLEGLFLNLLGLEVDLNEVELDISAIPRPGGLLGNLLSGVAGLLDKGPLSRLSDAISGFELPSMPKFELPSVSDLLPSGGEGGGISNMVYRMINEVLDMLLEALGDEESTDEEASNS